MDQRAKDPRYALVDTPIQLHELEEVEGNHVIFGVCCGSIRMIMHNHLMLTSSFHVPILTSQAKPKERPSSISYGR